jgi:hypothetical protein
MSAKLLGTAIALFVSVCASPASAQTIPETVRTLIANGVTPPLRSQISRALLDMDLDRMLAQADLILTGSLTLKQTYLSANQKEVLTDYVIVPNRIIRDRHPAERPKCGQGLTLTVAGGTMVIEGAELIVEDTDMELPVDRPLTLLLTRNDGGTYAIVGDVQGAFDMSDGQVKHLLKRSKRADEYRKMTPEGLIARLAAAK